MNDDLHSMEIPFENLKVGTFFRYDDTIYLKMDIRSGAKISGEEFIGMHFSFIGEKVQLIKGTFVEED